jgi:hypothetical protein
MTTAACGKTKYPKPPKAEEEFLPVAFLDFILRCLGLDAQGIIEFGLLDHSDRLIKGLGG